MQLPAIDSENLKIELKAKNINPLLTFKKWLVRQFGTATIK
jgi:hypothetical protein